MDKLVKTSDFSDYGQVNSWGGVLKEEKFMAIYF